MAGNWRESGGKVAGRVLESQAVWLAGARLHTQAQGVGGAEKWGHMAGNWREVEGKWRESGGKVSERARLCD